MAGSLLEGGSELGVVTPRQSPLRHLAGSPGVIGVLSGTPTERDRPDRTVRRTVPEAGSGPGG